PGALAEGLVSCLEGRSRSNGRTVSTWLDARRIAGRILRTYAQIDTSFSGIAANGEGASPARPEAPSARSNSVTYLDVDHIREVDASEAGNLDSVARHEG